MPNHFPTVAEYSIANANYAITVPEGISGADGRSGVEGGGASVLAFGFGFDTATADGDGNEIFSYGDFDQDTVETNLKAIADAIALAASNIYGITEATAKASISITRQWAINPDQDGPYTDADLKFETALLTVETVTYP